MPGCGVAVAGSCPSGRENFCPFKQNLTGLSIPDWRNRNCPLFRQRAGNLSLRHPEGGQRGLRVTACSFGFPIKNASVGVLFCGELTEFHFARRIAMIFYRAASEWSASRTAAPDFVFIAGGKDIFFDGEPAKIPGKNVFVIFAGRQ
jgi:hypothetical protein